MYFIPDYEEYCKYLENDIKKYHLTLFPTAQKFIEENYHKFHNNKYTVMMNTFLGDCNRMKLMMNGRSFLDISEKISVDIGEAVFPAVRAYIYCTLVRLIFISESGKFYLDDGRYLGDEYLPIVEKILSGTLENQILVCDKILIPLQRHGWKKGEKRDISKIREIYQSFGYEMFPSAVVFFEEIPCGEYHSWFESDGYNDIFIKPAQIHDKRINEKYLCIGYGCERAFFIGESGKFYARTSGSGLLEFSTMYEFFTWTFAY